MNTLTFPSGSHVAYFEHDETTELIQVNEIEVPVGGRLSFDHVTLLSEATTTNVGLAQIQHNNKFFVIKFSKNYLIK